MHFRPGNLGWVWAWTIDTEWFSDVCIGRREKKYLMAHRDSIVVKALCYKSDRRGFETERGKRILSIYLILRAALGPGLYSISNINEYQKQKIMFLGSIGRPVLRADKLTAIHEPIV
jgi:hypothetical protein